MNTSPHLIHSGVPPTLFTIGYGGKSQEQFLGIMRQHGIRMVVDVRLRPDRASVGTWIKSRKPDRGINGWLSRNGIEYVSFVELGNIFGDLPHWNPLYKELIKRGGDVLTTRLMASIQHPACLMCCEKDYDRCHRTYIAEWLSHQYSWEVVNL